VADRDADAGGHGEGLAGVSQLERLAQRLGQAVGEGVGCRFVGAGLDEHDELVSAKSPDGVLVAHGGLQTFPCDLQQSISGGVPEVVVDVLEAVDVDVQGTGDRSGLACGAGEHLRGAVEHERAVGEAGERVVQRQMGELAGLLAHERQRSRSPGRQDEHQQAEQSAQQSAAEQQHQRVPAAEHAAGDLCAEALHGPAVAERDLGALRVGGSVPAGEHGV
jgi:hypothetical protein